MTTHTETAAWKLAAAVPISGKPRTKAGREWVKRSAALAEAVETLEAIQRDQFEEAGDRERVEEQLRAAMTQQVLATDASARQVATQVIADLEQDLGSGTARDYARETDVAVRVCRRLAREVAEWVRTNGPELIAGELAPVATAAHDRLAEWIETGPDQAVADYVAAESLAVRILLPLGLDGSDLPRFQISGIRGEIEELRSQGVPYPLPQTFYDGRDLRDIEVEVA